MVFGFGIGGIIGGLLGEAMKKYNILDQADKDYWPSLLGLLFGGAGFGAGIYIVTKIFGD